MLSQVLYYPDSPHTNYKAHRGSRVEFPDAKLRKNLHITIHHFIVKDRRRRTEAKFTRGSFCILRGINLSVLFFLNFIL